MDLRGFRMTKKEYILDSLIDDDECFTQIAEYFKFCEKNGEDISELKRIYTYWKKTHTNE